MTDISYTFVGYSRFIGVKTILVGLPNNILQTSYYKLSSQNLEATQTSIHEIAKRTFLSLCHRALALYCTLRDTHSKGLNFTANDGMKVQAASNIGSTHIATATE
jgi:hypothetical protein